jgi:DNA repair ATPase RecN
MNLSQALKLKNRLAGELVRQQQILQRENARRSDSVSSVECEDVWEKIVDLSTQLGDLKGKITQANVDIYPALERMAELKSRISFVQGLQKREGPEVTFVGRDQEKVEYTWESYINQEKCDELVAELQEEINGLQDEIDVFNHSTNIEE